jgi:PPM family protein phosphatase
MNSFTGTDIGYVRTENEDSFLLRIPDDADTFQKKGVLAIVADGVGGGPDGKLASSMAVDIICSQYYSSENEDQATALLSAMRQANSEIYLAANNRSYDGMATTCTAFALLDGKGYLCHAGDSRAYLLHSGDFRRISKDHTLVEEMVDDEIISMEEAAVHPQRNIILKALGSRPDIDPDLAVVRITKTDTILLCSDGLYGSVSDTEMSSKLIDNHVETAGKKLIDLALERGGTDNITVVILKV